MQILLHSSIARNTTRILEDESGQSLKGIAEFIVAKHRHGALDTVRMRFRNTFAKFANLDDFAGIIRWQVRFSQQLLLVHQK
jgi:replicative DNA helicase